MRRNWINPATRELTDMDNEPEFGPTMLKDALALALLVVLLMFFANFGPALADMLRVEVLGADRPGGWSRP